MSFVIHDPNTSVPIVLLTISLLFIVVSIYIARNKESYAVYSRSHLLLALSNILNYLEIVAFISLGILFQDNAYFLDSKITILLFIAIALNHSFYIANLLKVIRVITLINLSSANFSMKSSSKLKAKLGAAWNIKVGVAYTLVSLIPRSILYTLKYEDQLGENEFRTYLATQFRIQAGVESLILVCLLFYIKKQNCDVTLRLEYIFSTIAWASAVGLNTKENIVYMALVLPIRNIGMAIISTASVYEHIKNYKLPLPDFIDLEFILHHRYLTTKVREHLEKTQNKKWIILFELLLDICIFVEKDAAEYFAIIQKDLLNYSNLSGYSLPIERGSFSQQLKTIYDELYIELDEGFISEYIESKYFEEIKIDYC